MGVVQNIRLEIKICELYYLEKMSQKEISARMGISRPQISRILANAKEMGLVSVKINNPYGGETKLEHKLIETFGLTDALVVGTEGADSRERMENFGREAAEYLEHYLPAGGRVGVVGGSTVRTIVDHMRPSGKRVAEVVPMAGGVGMGNVDIHANNIAQRFTYVHGGTAYSLNAPVVVSDSKTAFFLRKEPTIARVLELGSACDIAIVGIGSVAMNATNVKAGGLTAADIDYLKHEGAVGSVCTSYINAEGKEVGENLNGRSIGQSLDSMKNVKIIASAIGESKVPAIRAVLKSGCVDVFFTNTSTAQQLFEKQ